MNKEVKVVKKKRKLNWQKIFNLISFTFILACIIFYGTRFIRLYLQNNKKEEIKVLADNIKDNNEGNLKNINSDYYFTGKEVNNYVKYSNILFRIIKINKDNSITLISDKPITSLAKGDNNDYKTSYINNWLNNQDKENTGILEKNLNNPNKYLTYTNACNDKIDNTIKEPTYVDDNPIKLGIFLSNNNYNNKIVIEDTYYTNFTSMNDIASFEVFLTSDKEINGNSFKDIWNKYYNNYQDISKYKIGYNIGYTLKDGTINSSNFLEPDILRYGEYFQIYFYDDINAPDGFYSHLESTNDNTLITSVKFFAVNNIDEVENITLTVFTYDNDDFDDEGNYRGNSKYTINIKRK